MGEFEVWMTLYCMKDKETSSIVNICLYIFQISTSALQSPLRVMKTLNARIVTARSVACVNKGSPETGEHAKVLHEFFRLVFLYLV